MGERWVDKGLCSKCGMEFEQRVWTDVRGIYADVSLCDSCWEKAEKERRRQELFGG